MHFVFDLDGVLIDTAPVIRESYRLAGARPPDDILAYEGIDWLVGQVGARRALQVRRRKNVFYLRALGEGVRTLPPYLVAKQLVAERHDVHVLTGAPQGALDVLRGRREWAWLRGRDQVRTPEKMKLLAQLCSSGAYVDDQRKFSEIVPSGWRFVWYDGQEERELYRELLRREEP